MSFSPNTTFVSKVTVISRAWLQAVNDFLVDLGSAADVAKGDALVAVKSTATSSIARTQHDKNEETYSVKDAGATGLGVLNDAAAFVTALAKNRINIPAGAYKLDSSVTPTMHDIQIDIDPGATFSGTGLLKFNNLLPILVYDVFGHHVSSITYDQGWDGYFGIFSNAFFAKSTLDRSAAPIGPTGEGNGAICAVLCHAEGAVAGSQVWGANIVGLSSAAGATALACEFNPVVTVSGGTAYGVVIASAGYYAVENAIQIQTNETASQFKNGIYFNFVPTKNCITGMGIFFGGSAGAGNTVTRFLASAFVRATEAEIDLPSFAVLASKPTPANRVSVEGTQAGDAPIIAPIGTDTNLGMILRSKGTGDVTLGGDSLNVAVRASNAGLGFFGTSASAKPTITGSRDENAALASLLSNLAFLGLITDSTTS